MMCWKKEATPLENKESNVAEKGSIKLVVVLNNICICFLQTCVILRNGSVLFILSIPFWFIFIASHGNNFRLQSSSKRSHSSNYEFESRKLTLKSLCCTCWNLKNFTELFQYFNFFSRQENEAFKCQCKGKHFEVQ